MDMQLVWDGQSVVHATGVTGERNDPTRRVQERGTSDNWARSQSPKSRRHMFGKGGQRPTARILSAR